MTDDTIIADCTTTDYDATDTPAADGLSLDGLTMERLIDHCLRMCPDEAARKGDSTLCVTPLVTRLIIDGQTHELDLEKGRWGALEVRVSSNPQRSALFQQIVEEERKVQDAARGGGRKRAIKQDGYSEEEQITRGIRHFVRAGQAFKIYSDAGVTGEYPNNDPSLIRRLLDKKVARYEGIFRKTLLDETSRTFWTPTETAQLEAYLAQTLRNIRRGQVSEDLLVAGKVTASSTDGGGPSLFNREDDGQEGVGGTAPTVTRRRGRPGNKVFFRQGFTQLWQDIGMVHTIAISDRSRLCRDADLETATLERMAQHGTRLVGLMEDLSSLDVSDPLRKGLTYLIASINEQRLTEIAQASFKGTVQRLRSGRPGGKPPWWLMRDEDGRTLVREEMRPVVERIVELSLSGLGARVIQGRLYADGVCVDGKPLSLMQVQYILTHDVLAGKQTLLGLSWDVYPRLVDDETLADLHRGRKARAEKTEHLRNERSWAQHLFTGVLRCACGARMVCSRPTKARREAGESGYYRCEALNKDKKADAVHAWLNERHLEAFFAEIFRHHPDLVSRALSVGDGRALAASARRQHLEGRLALAEVAYAAREVQARAQAEAAAAGLNLSAASAGYDSVVAGLMESLLVEEASARQALALELSQARMEAGENRRAARALAAAEELGGWDDLDIPTKNRLLRVLLDRVVVYAMGRMRPGRGCGGYLEIWLAGVDTPLPPVRMKRGKGKTVLLPTPAEWIADMFSSGTALAEAVSGKTASTDVSADDCQ